MKIKNIVFDLGNVLIDFIPKEYLEKYITESKRDDFYNAIFPTKEWLRLDDGTLSYEDAKVIFKNRVPNCTDEIDEFFDFRFYDMLAPIWKNVAVLNEIADQKPKYNLYILSNFHKEAIEELKSRYKFFDKFDDVRRISHVLDGFYSGRNDLYRDASSNKYYLVAHKSEHTPKEFNKVCNIISEYAYQKNYVPANEAFFKEHGNVIIEEAAIQTLAAL